MREDFPCTTIHLDELIHDVTLISTLCLTFRNNAFADPPADRGVIRETPIRAVTRGGRVCAHRGPLRLPVKWNSTHRCFNITGLCYSSAFTLSNLWIVSSPRPIPPPTLSYPPHTFGAPTPPAPTLSTPKAASEQDRTLLTTSTRVAAGWLENWMRVRFICCTSSAPEPFPLSLPGGRGLAFVRNPIGLSGAFVLKLSRRTVNR